MTTATCVHPGLMENNHPIDEIESALLALFHKHPNMRFWQKFTCVKCGSRQTMEQANRLYTSGECEECGFVTNIKETGCNYLLMLGG